MDLREVASGLRFPEGPIAMPDGSFLVVEIQGKTLKRITADGRQEVVAELGGGPNGAAIGPDGRCYVCNNGGFSFHQVGDLTLPGLAPEDYAGGWIDVVDLKTGAHEVLYRQCGDQPLRGPNDIVFDQYGGFYFTDPGKVYARSRDRGAVFYAHVDGSFIKQVIFPVEGANGIGLSPDDQTLYVAESPSGRMWAFELTGPGQIRRVKGPVPWERGHFVGGVSTYSIFDSLAIDAEGNICVADLPHSGITVMTPKGEVIERHAMPDIFPTNICFGGEDLRTAYITLSSAGKLVAMDWPRPGLPLHWLNRRPEGAAS
ncbi:gluconolactonase [Rhodoligotrophos appendicifer]|uniref:SMP-30/gluconolactonase/LRE family protein n=1 Tax=Rhodoligotrophos appendicifer TaxID=987056 RepID=UPI0011847C78|nr:SMP-30/gluconolactonase/LRE family protein [Rhodoligotrophos appendicifer]